MLMMILMTMKVYDISYAFDRELNVVDRILWVLVVIAFSGIAAALSWNLWSQWNDEQVLITRIQSTERFLLKLVQDCSPRPSSWANAGGNATCPELDVSFAHMW